MSSAVCLRTAAPALLLAFMAVFSAPTHALEAFLIDDDNAYWDADVGISNGAVVFAPDAQLLRTYVGGLGRLPDTGGFQWWADELRTGRHNVNSMAAGFVFSIEFQESVDADNNGIADNNEFLLHMYRNVFRREPDTEGFNWWLTQLDSGARTQSTALVEMTQSNEFVQLTLPGILEFFFGFVASEPTENFVQGEHYRDTVLSAANLLPGNELGNTDVLLFFSHLSPQSFQSDSAFTEWAAALAGNVGVERVPVAWNDAYELLAKAHYTAVELGVEVQVRQALYELIHIKREPPVSSEDIASVFEASGISRTAFFELIDSSEIATRVAYGGILTAGLMVDSIPKILVAGRYMIEANSSVPTIDAMLRVADYLLQTEEDGSGDPREDRNTIEARAFFAENGQRESVVTTASGLQYEVIRSGAGSSPILSDTVEVHYSGSFLDGTVFDSSYARGEPIQFAVSQVIEGWTEGLQLMNVGSYFRLFIPSELAYGSRGVDRVIAPNAALIFDVELLAITGASSGSAWSFD